MGFHDPQYYEWEVAPWVLESGMVAVLYYQSELEGGLGEVEGGLGELEGGLGMVEVGL